MSLLELVVATAIAMLLLTATYELMLPGLGAWTSSNERAHLRQHALSLLTRIRHDLEMTCSDSIWMATSTDPGTQEATATLTFLDATDASGNIHVADDGSVIWQSYEVIYHNPVESQVSLGHRPLQYSASNELVRHLTTVVRDPYRDRCLCRQVVGLSVESPIDTFFAVDQDPTRLCPVVVRAHLRDLHQDCLLETAATSQLYANLPGEVTSK